MDGWMGRQVGSCMLCMAIDCHRWMISGGGAFARWGLVLLDLFCLFAEPNRMCWFVRQVLPLCVPLSLSHPCPLSLSSCEPKLPTLSACLSSFSWLLVCLSVCLRGLLCASPPLCLTYDAQKCISPLPTHLSLSPSPCTIPSPRGRTQAGQARSYARSSYLKAGDFCVQVGLVW